MEVTSMAMCSNLTWPNCTLESNETVPQSRPVNVWSGVFAVCYTLICMAGLVGNGLVIFVVLRYAKMKTVTNIYILNLAISDLCFLIGLPFLIVTLTLEGWVFGNFLCKVFYILTSINWFTSVFTLIVMSADRYLAVCHPVRSMSYRTPLISRIVCICVWLASMLVMLPVMLYARTVDKSCTIMWPQNQAISREKAFIWYTLLLGFAIPSALISVFYLLVVLRLRTVGPKTKSKEKKKSHRKVTKMVLTVIAVYIICWLPYWCFQVALTFVEGKPPKWAIFLFQIITVMSYANSMLNPLLYAFFSENFRKTFLKAFSCASPADVNGALQVEHSMYPGSRKSGGQTMLSAGISSSAKTKLTSVDVELDDDEEDNDEKPEAEAELQPVMDKSEQTDSNHFDESCSKPTAVWITHRDHPRENGCDEACITVAFLLSHWPILTFLLGQGQNGLYVPEKCSWRWHPSEMAPLHNTFYIGYCR